MQVTSSSANSKVQANSATTDTDQTSEQPMNILFSALMSVQQSDAKSLVDPTTENRSQAKAAETQQADDTLMTDELSDFILGQLMVINQINPVSKNFSAQASSDSDHAEQIIVNDLASNTNATKANLVAQPFEDHKNIQAFTTKAQDTLILNRNPLAIQPAESIDDIDHVIAEVEPKKMTIVDVPEKIVNAFTQIGLMTSHGLLASTTQSEVVSSQMTAPLQTSYASSMQEQTAFHASLEVYPEFTHVDANHGYDAQINIYPPELGRVIAKLKMNKNGAELSITTSSDKVRQVIEAGIVQLKQHFNQNDIYLTNVKVDVATSEQFTDSQTARGQHQAHVYSDSVVDKNDKVMVENPKKESRINSVVDTYA